MVGRIKDTVFLEEIAEEVIPLSPEYTKIFARPIHVLPFLLKVVLAIMLVLRVRQVKLRRRENETR